MIAERIKALRKQKGITQAELARIIGVTRSCVNAWEIGISVPSTHYIVKLSNIFGVSSDYLLNKKDKVSIDVTGLSESDIALIADLVSRLKKK